MLPVLVTEAGTLDGARVMAGGLSELGLFYIVGIQAAVIVALFTLLMQSWWSRLQDALSVIKENTRALDSSTQATTSMARAVESKIPTPRGKKPPLNEDADAKAGGPGTGPAPEKSPQAGGPPAGV